MTSLDSILIAVYLVCHVVVIARVVFSYDALIKVHKPLHLYFFTLFAPIGVFFLLPSPKYKEN